MTRRLASSPQTGHRRQAGTRASDHGSATVELVLGVPFLLLMLLFAVFCGRLADTRLRIDDVAHQSARAASLARTPTAATTDARTTAQAALAEAGVTCQSLDVGTDLQGLRPGATVTVTISCTVQLDDLALLGVPGTTTLHASFASVVDVYRGTTTAVAGGSAAAGGGGPLR